MYGGNMALGVILRAWVAPTEWQGREGSCSLCTLAPAPPQLPPLKMIDPASPFLCDYLLNEQ